MGANKEKSEMLNSTSPDNTDGAIEREIQAKGKTAPRVTPDALQANISDCYYFTGADGAKGAMEQMTQLTGYHKQLELLTFCVLVLRNGFTVTGESACASPENYDRAIGERIARQNAEQKIWPLMGYQLREQIFQSTQPTQQPE